jgi:hypothetical protein
MATIAARVGQARDVSRYSSRGWADHDAEELVTRPAIDNLVRLPRDFPELGLVRGQVGAVKAVWCEPTGAFEVEFRCGVGTFPTRALLLEDAIHVVDVSLHSNSVGSPHG